MRMIRIQTALAIAATIGVAACSDPTEIDEHFEVDGVAIYVGTDEIYRHTLDEGDPGTFTLAQGAHDVSFVLLDDQGLPISEDDHVDEPGEEHEFEIVIDDPEILTWTPEADDGGVHDFVEFHGELNALQPGSTTMRLCVPHDNTHCDFEADVPVTVVAAT